MKIGVLGTGVAGQALAGKLVMLGHDVMMGARSADNEKAQAFAAATGGRAGAFADAAGFGEIVVHCTRGNTAMDVLNGIGPDPLSGKLLIDVSNPLDFSNGYPPSLCISNTDSLAELMQRTFPRTHVVKTLNTVTASVMVDPGRLPGKHVVFVSGNDRSAKGRTMDLLRSFGWQDIIDLGDISTARGTEQMLPLWVRLYGALGTGEFNFILTRA